VHLWASRAWSGLVAGSLVGALVVGLAGIGLLILTAIGSGDTAAFAANDAIAFVVDTFVGSALIGLVLGLLAAVAGRALDWSRFPRALAIVILAAVAFCVWAYFGSTVPAGPVSELGGDGFESVLVANLPPLVLGVLTGVVGTVSFVVSARAPRSAPPMWLLGTLCALGFGAAAGGLCWVLTRVPIAWISGRPSGDYAVVASGFDGNLDPWAHDWIWYLVVGAALGLALASVRLVVRPTAVLVLVGAAIAATAQYVAATTGVVFPLPDFVPTFLQSEGTSFATLLNRVGALDVTLSTLIWATGGALCTLAALRTWSALAALRIAANRSGSTSAGS
jgi:hypothetical protein